MRHAIALLLRNAQCHGGSVYNGNLRGPRHKNIAERLTVSCKYMFGRGTVMPSNNNFATFKLLICYLVGVNQYIDISIRTGIRLSGDIRYIVLTIRQYNVGFENRNFDCRPLSS